MSCTEPCNCDQALEAERQRDAYEATAARQGTKLARIAQLLEERSGAPLRESRFGHETLEAIRQTLLERPWEA